MRSGQESDAFVVVALRRDEDSVHEVTAVLEPLGIPVDVIGRGRQLRRISTVVLRVPPDRAGEAIVALELKGFSDVAAYQMDATDEQR